MKNISGKEAPLMDLSHSISCLAVGKSSLHRHSLPLLLLLSRTSKCTVGLAINRHPAYSTPAISPKVFMFFYTSSPFAHTVPSSWNIFPPLFSQLQQPLKGQPGQHLLWSLFLALEHPVHLFLISRPFPLFKHLYNILL